MSAPAVTVVIPAYRVTQYIAESVDSILAQTFRDFEIVVVNDGCPDSVALEAVLQPYAPRIVYLRTENRGPSAARNAGIRAARAPLIALLDGDDAWTPNYLEVQLKALGDDPAADVVYSNGVVIEADEAGQPRVGPELMDLSPSAGAVTFASLIGLRCSVTCSVTARKATLLGVGGFDESLRRAEDFDLWLRIVLAGGRIVYHREPLLRYRRRAGSLSASGIAMREAGLLVLDKAARNERLPSDARPLLAAARRRFEWEIDYLRGRDALGRGDLGAALEAYRRAGRARWSLRNALRIGLICLAPALARRLGARAVR